MYKQAEHDQGNHTMGIKPRIYFSRILDIDRVLTSKIERMVDKKQPGQSVTDIGRTQDSPQSPTKENPTPASNPSYHETQINRLKADFDNYRRNAQKEVQSARHSGMEDNLKEILPAISNLERAIYAMRKAKAPLSLTQGIQNIYGQFLEVLKKLDVQRIESVGRAYNPTLHEAIDIVETEQLAPGTILDEIEPGYRIGETVLIPSKVRVAKKKNS